MPFVQKIAGVLIIVIGLGLFFFSKKIFASSSDLPPFDHGPLDRWTGSMLDVWIFLTRIIGILIAGIGMILLLGGE